MAAHVTESEEYREALRMFDEAHREDPRRVTVQGEEVPWSLLYHRRLHHWVERLSDPASESLLLAARCQHIRRWRIPRSNYPMDRTGYRRWRKTLLRFHAQQAREILEQAGYEEEMIRRVQELVQKLRLKLDPEVQLFEDAICLVFLENEFVDFLGKHEEDKIIEILQKTWKKMSKQGHQAALELVETLPPDARRVVGKAL